MVSVTVLALVVVVGLGAVGAAVRWGMRWGATPAELADAMPGDEWLDGPAQARVAMTRAISIEASPDAVWPWIAQMGRGAGWYSYDRLDNGGRPSARHVVSWIPAPCLGDAAAIGYLRHLDAGRELAWWVPGEWFLGATTRLVFSVRLRAEGTGTRLVTRISGDAAGRGAWLVRLLFCAIDSAMARRQLLGVRWRLAGGADLRERETGARDQFQAYEVIYASGERAGTTGREQASRWREAALAAGLGSAQPEARAVGDQL